MSRLVIAPIVEGDGEVHATRTLLERIWYELLQGEYIEVLRPILEKRDRLITNKDGKLDRALRLAVGKLAQSLAPNMHQAILVLIDAHDDLPCQLGPRVLTLARHLRSDQDIVCVVANVEYETWFVAAADSLRSELDLTDDVQLPMSPELLRSGKGWIERRIRTAKYSETVDQPRLTAKMDLGLCRSRSPSFDKLCRDLEARASRPAVAN